MGRTEQLALDLVDPVEPRTLPNWGWWTLNRRLANGRMSQKAYRREHMEFVLRHIRRDVDTYMSQAFFDAPCRRAMHLAYATHAYVDLDIYRAETLRGLGAEQIAGLLLLHCRDEGVPLPSVIISSGRGLYMKYFWASPIGRSAAGRAVAVNRALVKLFAAFGADPAAVDMARILRVVGTVNTKSGEIARTVWANERDGGVVAYDFDTFADEILPYSMEQILEFRAAAEARRAEVRVLSQERARRDHMRSVEERRKSGGKAFCHEDWHWGVLEDIRWLAAHRWPDGMVEPGDRDTFGFLGACQLARVVPAASLWGEIQSWARILLPPDYIDRTLSRQCSTLLRYAQEDAVRDPDAQARAYRYRKDRLIEMLKVEPGEMRHMTRLIDDEEKRRRARDRWRASHTGLSRDEWRASVGDEARARARRAGALRAGGLTWAAVAAELGLPSADAARQLASRAG